MKSVLKNFWFWVSVWLLLVNLFVCMKLSKGESCNSNLKVEEFYRSADSGGNLQIVFDSPMVEKHEVGKEAPREILKITPLASGRLFWKDQRTLVFCPDKNLRAATEYRVLLKTGIKSLSGAPLKQSREFVFQTERLKFKYVKQVQYGEGKPCEILVGFNNKVSPESLKSRLTLFRGGLKGTPLKYTVTTTAPDKILRVKTAPLTGDAIGVRLEKGLQGTSGTLGLSEDIEKDLRLDVYFRISGARGKIYYNNPYIEISSSQKILERDFKKYLSINPHVDFSATSNFYDNTCNLCGNFQAGKIYQVTIKKGLPAEYGQVLKKDFVRNVRIPDFKPEVKFKAQGIYMNSKGKMLLPFECVNIDRIKFSAYPLYLNNLVYYMRGYCDYYKHRTLSGRPLEETLLVKPEMNKKTMFNLDLGKILKGKNKGLFVIESDISCYRQIVMITDIGITVRKSDRDFLVWANKLSTSRPLPNAQVAVYSRSNQKLLEGKTDEKGIAHFKYVKFSAGEEPFAVGVSLDGDTAFLELDGSRLNMTSFETKGRPHLSKGYEAILFTDREIFRPGEKVHLNSIVRGPAQKMPGEFPVIFDIFRPDGKIFKKINGMVSSSGNAEIDLHLPISSRTGRYRAIMKIPGSDKAIGRISFIVEDFMADTIRAKINAEKKIYSAGDKLPFSVNAEYLFGAPAANLSVVSKCTLCFSPFVSHEYKEFDFCNDENKEEDIEKNLGSIKTNGEGNACFSWTVPKAKPGSAILIKIGSTVKNHDGRAVSTRVFRKAHLSPFYLGIRRRMDGFAQEGKAETFDFIALDANGKIYSLGNSKLTVDAFRIKENWVLQSDSHGRHRYETVKEEIRADKKILDASKALSFSFSPEKEGDYRIVLTDAERGVSTDVCFYCASPWGGRSWSRSRPDRLDLQLDKSVFQPESEATLLIKSPVKGPALLTIEGDRVYDAMVFYMDSNTKKIKLPLKKDYGSGVYCVVSVLNRDGGKKAFESFRAFGATPLNIDCESNRLNIKMDAPEKIRPGGKLKFSLKALNSKGSGVPAVLTVAAVDEGICRLTGMKLPDPFSFFYGRRGLEVGSFDLYSLLMPEPEDKNAGADSSVAGGALPEKQFKNMLNPVLNRRIKNLALWKANIPTDRNGGAEVEFDLPKDFTGELRLFVIASSGKDFGSVQQAVKVRQPLTLQASFPRFLAPGDEFYVPIKVFNQTASGGVAALSLTPDKNVELIENGKLNLDIPKGKSAMSFFKLRAPDVPGNIKIKVSAVMGKEKSSQSVEIPVRPPAAFEKLSGFGLLRKEKSASFKLPGGFMKGTEKIRIVFSNTPTIRFGKALDYVMNYPYGCVEQTTSSSFPLLYLADAAMLANSKTPDKELVKEFVQCGIDRLLSMQLSYGGFSMWPGASKPYLWGSVYATHFLTEARKAGYEFPKESLDSALHFLKKQIKKDTCPLPVKAYGVYVLALNGRFDRHGALELKAQSDELAKYSKFQLALTLAIMKEKDPAFEISKLPLDFKGDRIEIDGALSSPVRDVAIALSAYIDISPEHPNVQALAKRLIMSMRHGRWGNTQENGFALMALGKYARHEFSQQGNYHAEVSSGDKTLASFADTRQVVLTPIGLSGKAIRIRKSGPGTLYYYWQAEGVPMERKIKNEDWGVKVRRIYSTFDGKPCELSKLKQGELIKVTLIMESERKVENMAVSDLLPAGLEIENQKLATSEKVKEELNIEEILKGLPDGSEEYKSEKNREKPKAFEPERVECRDDRLLLFGTFPGGVRVYSYLARAVTKGKFVLPSVSASCMYSPEIKSVNGSGEVSICD